ncbi:hypothetical protein DPMN_128541 [Dreissena polymorpha]|uniref:Uncharacterized protein n=1 Tax=Dreissena polymorpha TaxID=45954 RepID=A0A9D4H1D1_DREPO|nr:hypothetical protein DPMN_128541 [Dreissena polymorpha]
MLKVFLAQKTASSKSTDGAGSFSLYVETKLKLLSGSLRREAEQRIQQVLHDVESKAEPQKSAQQPLNQVL